VKLGGRLAIVPRPGHESDLLKNPYISYNCLRIAGSFAVASNGSHTDPIAEKLESGVPVRDALASVLLALDYERDDYSTPRIAAVVPSSGDSAWLGVVRRDALEVRELTLTAGRAVWIATYEAADVSAERSLPFDAEDAGASARATVHGEGFAELEKPVAAAGALARGNGFALGTFNV